VAPPKQKLTPEDVDRLVAKMRDDEAAALLSKLKAEAEAKARVQADVDFGSFVRQCYPDFEENWHHTIMFEALQRFSRAVAERKSPRLMINMPPRHGKSSIATERFPVWHLAHYPSHEIMVASNTQDLANIFSRSARALATDFQGQFPGLAQGTTWGVEQWRVKGGGCYTAVGAGTAIQGKGAHILVIDDILSGQQAAMSDLQRNTVWEWYRADAYSRRAPGAGVLCISTRWHLDDPPGRMLAIAEQTGEKWEVISLPAIAEHDEKYRKAGEALHPARFPLAELEVSRAMDPGWFAAMYQQNPVPRSGGLFKRDWLAWDENGQPIHRFDDHPQRPETPWDEVAITVDTGFKAKESADPTAILVWGRRGPKFCLLDAHVQRMDLPTLREVFRLMVIKWPQAGLKLIEERASGVDLIADMKSQISGIVPYDPAGDGDKFARANRVTPYFAAGDVLFPQDRYAPWLRAYVEELANFPYAKHDDQVDATSQLLSHWTAKGTIKHSNRGLELLLRQFGPAAFA